jgi:ATP-binding cassette, subfamily B, bacterial PglK
MNGVWQLVREGLRLFTNWGRLVLWLYGFSLVLLAALDAAALFLLARVFNLGSTAGSSQIVVDTTATSLLLILLFFCLRSALSSVAIYIALRQGAHEEVLIGQRALATLINPRTQTSSDGLSDFHNSVDRGPKELVLIIFHAITVPCEALTGVAIIAALVIFQPLTAFMALVYFVVVAIAQQLLLSQRSTNVGEALVQYTNSVYQSLADIQGLRRILSVNSAASALSAITTARAQLTRARALQTFIATLPRYFLELVLAVGLLVVGGATYLVSGAPAALAATTLFVAAGFRLLPIVNRIQSLTLAILAYAPTAQLALRHYATVLAPVYPPPIGPRNVVELHGVSFTYDDSSSPEGLAHDVLQNVSLDLEHGKQYALVGPSGAGKTTLVDLLLGLHVAQTGSMHMSPALRSAYVPQDAYIASLPLRHNVALHWSDHNIDNERVATALQHAGLQDFLARITDDTPLDANALSGGQKQRIGLARALYADANFLVLDEVTSALDVETEQQIYATINALRGVATVVIVAHRLSTVQRADKVFYLDNGAIAGSGTFFELSSTLPAFRRQIELSQIDTSN